MASRLSRPRRTGSRSDRRALYGRLLREGGRFPDPVPHLLQAAAELEALGLILLRRSRAVFCANSDDRDFPPFDPDCPGVIELRDTADEGGGDYACPACGRTVYPTLKAKQQIDLLTVNLDQRAIERFVAGSCSDTPAGQVFERGVLVIPDRPQNRFICILDFCTDPRFLATEWVGSQPCVYVAVDSKGRASLGLPIDARHVALADLVCGGATLAVRSEHDGRSSIPHPSVDRGLRSDRLPASLPVPDQGSSQNSPHRFSVGLVEDGVLVDGIVVACDTNGIPYLAFVELLQQATTDLATGRAISPLTANAAAMRIKDRLPAGVVNPDTVQKGLKRLDRRIVRHLRQNARFIEEGDIVENVTRAKKYRGELGFRLNSDRVAIVPGTLKPR